MVAQRVLAEVGRLKAIGRRSSERKTQRTRTGPATGDFNTFRHSEKAEAGEGTMSIGERITVLVLLAPAGGMVALLLLVPAGIAGRIWGERVQQYITFDTFIVAALVSWAIIALGVIVFWVGWDREHVPIDAPARRPPSHR